MEEKIFKKILIIQLRQIGDILLTTPAIKVLKEKYPQSHIAFLTEPMGYEILEGNPYLDEIIISKDRRIKSKVKLIKKIRKRRFDLVFDFLGSCSTALISYFSKAKYRIGFDLRYRGRLYNYRVKREGLAEYTVNTRLRLLKSLGIEPLEKKLDFFIPEKAERKVALFLKDKEISKKDLIITIAPLSRRQARAWEKEKFAELADRLSKEYKAKIIFIWGPGEREEIEKIISLMKEKPIISFKTSLKEVAALIKLSDLFISNDNGPMHIAVAVKTPTLTIYGPTDERCCCPGGPKHKTIRAEVECARCEKRVCEDMKCMKELEVSSVLNMVRDFGQIIPKIKYTNEKAKYSPSS